ncbi:hypothetical protein EVJ58_g5233 [Rhodofomes roseus]|uniref:SWIM-type domain-containing protein n=1 Tax=Rhodofomes roseus TaxID=34475 RepID=A0A4Y9YCN4_9APHY|nr:hypothetical protein EVJ58_g5233 [Rhodofomes roseus]
MPKRKAELLDLDAYDSWMPPRPARPYSHASPSYVSASVPATQSASAAAPPAKKQRKKANAAPPGEKRGARFYMVDRQRNGDELKEEFSVLGSTGNVYTVIVDKTPSCNCPDATKGNHCKHILFIFLKVLQVTQASGYWYQKALLTSELQDVFSHAPLAPNALAHAHVREAYARATGKASSSSAAAKQSDKKRVPGPDDDCPICYENMHRAKENTLVWCEECGNGLHKECFTQWATTARSKAQLVTCVFCRARWVGAGAGAGAGGSAAGGSSYAEGYVNLADVAGVNRVRDTSSYYQGPSRGKRHYGYVEYVDDF